MRRVQRLRPADMWLEHAEYTLPGAAVWDWYLRPLARGEPAVPLRVSGREGVLPALDIVRATVVADAAGFRDESIVCEMLTGVEDDNEWRWGTVLCAPHAGTLVAWQWPSRRRLRTSLGGGPQVGTHCRVGPCV